MKTFRVYILFVFMVLGCSKKIYSNEKELAQFGVIASTEPACQNEKVIIRVNLENNTNYKVLLTKEHVGIGSVQHTPSFWVANDPKFISKVKYKRTIIDHIASSADDSIIVLEPVGKLSFDYNLSKYYAIGESESEVLYIKYRGFAESVSGDYVNIDSSPIMLDLAACKRSSKRSLDER